MGAFDVGLVMPVLALAGFGLFVLLWSPFLRGASWALGAMSLIGIAVAAVATHQQWRVWRAQGAAMETAGGMVRIDGLGLAFSRTIIEEHGGSLRLVKTGPDGTVFEIVLPVSDGM